MRQLETEEIVPASISSACQWIDGNTVLTQMGHDINLADISMSQFELRDIVLCLSRLPLYNGHTPGHDIYSVAARSVWLSRYIYKLTEDPKRAIHGLMHYAACAYLGLSVTAIDTVMEDIELDIKRNIYLSFNLPALTPEDCILIETAIAQVKALELTHFFPLSKQAAEFDGAFISDTARQLKLIDMLSPWQMVGIFISEFEMLKEEL